MGRVKWEEELGMKVRKIINTIKQEQGLAGYMRMMLYHVEKGHQLNLLCLPEI